MAKDYVFSRPDGSQRKVSGYKYKAPNPNAKRFAAAEEEGKSLPPKVHSRGHMTPVENQGELSSCVANAVAGAYEYLVKRHRGDDAYDISRTLLTIMREETAARRATTTDSIIVDAIESLREEGACSEATWPYDEERVNEEPSADAYEEASQFLVEDMQLVPTTLEDWRAALGRGTLSSSVSRSMTRLISRRSAASCRCRAPRSRRASPTRATRCSASVYSDPDKVFIVRTRGARTGVRRVIVISRMITVRTPNITTATRGSSGRSRPSRSTKRRGATTSGSSVRLTPSSVR